MRNKKEKSQVAENNLNKVLAFHSKSVIFGEQMKYKVAPSQKKGRKKLGREYDELAEQIKSLPESKSVHFEVPKGQAAVRVRTKLYNVLRNRGVEVSIVQISGDELEISKAS
jgi:hypothetical protein